MKGVRIVNIFFAVALCAVFVFAALFLYRDFQQLDHLESEKRMLENRFDILQAEVDSQEKKQARLKYDTEYLEKVIRQKLNYAKEGEDVFRFE